MKTRILTSAIALTLTALAMGVAQAQSANDAPKTRAEVRAETAAAIRSGDVASGFEGLKMNELQPTMYPSATELRNRPVAANASTTKRGRQVVETAPVAIVTK